MSRKSDVISLLTIDNDIELKGNDDSGCKSSGTAITRPIEPNHSESEPGAVLTRSGRVIKPPNRLSFLLMLVSCVHNLEKPYKKEEIWYL